MADCGAIARVWDQRLHQTFTCCGRTVCVRLATLEASGAAKFETLWVPSPPPRFGAGEVARFDREFAKAKAVILAHVASVSEATT